MRNNPCIGSVHFLVGIHLGWMRSWLGAAGILAVGLCLASCHSKPEKVFIYDVIAASNLDAYSIAFGPEKPDSACAVIGDCPETTKAMMDSLRGAGRIMAFFASESVVPDSWEEGYKSSLRRMLDSTSFDRFEFAMGSDAEQIRMRLIPERIRMEGFKIYPVNSCSNKDSIGKLTKAAPSGEIFGECLSFHGVRCNLQEDKCLLTAVVNFNSFQGMSIWLMLEKVHQQWVVAERVKQMHW